MINQAESYERKKRMTHRSNHVTVVECCVRRAGARAEQLRIRQKLSVQRDETRTKFSVGVARNPIRR